MGQINTIKWVKGGKKEKDRRTREGNWRVTVLDIKEGWGAQHAWIIVLFGEFEFSLGETLGEFIFHYRLEDANLQAISGGLDAALVHHCSGF